MQIELPLAGIVVVELSDNASLPFGGQVLAALGAEVWKVERPGGDAPRRWGPSAWKGTGCPYHAVNRGKRSVCIDIKNPEELASLHELIVGHADVFMHNLRPGAAERYGLDPESLRARKPELICCELGAYGHLGPMRKDPGYDPMMQAFAGIMSLTGEEGQAPVRAGVSLIDHGTGIWAAMGVLAALLRRERSSRGATVHCSLLETAIAWMGVGIANYAANGEPGSRHGSGIAIIVPHRAYEAADGHLVLSSPTDRLFSRLADALGHPEWATDPRFATNEARLLNRATVDALIEGCVILHTRAFWKDHFDRLGLSSAPVQSIAELCAHEQTRALGILGKPSEDEMALVGLPLSFDRRRPPPLHAVHELGQDNQAFMDLLARPGAAAAPDRKAT